MRRINFIRPESFIAAIEALQCGKPFTEIDSKDFEIPYFEVKPPEGYEAKPNFPNCCNFHKSIYHTQQQWFEKFPRCCKEHKRLLKEKWFKRENYKTVATKVVTQVAYTQYHLEQSISKPAWYKEITDYIQYNFRSFGQLPTGFGNSIGGNAYMQNVRNWIERVKTSEAEIEENKKKLLLAFIDKFYDPIPVINSSIEILNDTYKKWVNTFPFQISYFQELKKDYDNRLAPLIDGETEYNKYLGTSSGKALTQVRLIEFLVSLTKNLLQKVDTVKLLEAGHITNTKKHTIDLVNELHRIKQTALLTEFTSGEYEYVSIVTVWLENEKNYFKEITPLVLNNISEELATTTHDEIEVSTSAKPVFDPEIISEVFDYLKGFFSIKHQLLFEGILKTGGNSKNFLLFKDNGNRLADSFKQLYDADLITGCQKKDLEQWIMKNFKYQHRGKENKFKPRYLSDIISTRKDKCQNPIINVSLNRATGKYSISKT